MKFQAGFFGLGTLSGGKIVDKKEAGNGSITLVNKRSGKWMRFSGPKHMLAKIRQLMLTYMRCIKHQYEVMEENLEGSVRYVLTGFDLRIVKKLLTA
jgi:hypothetical protein